MEYVGANTVRPYDVSATNFDFANYHTIHTVGDGFPVPREAKRLPYDGKSKVSAKLQALSCKDPPVFPAGFCVY